MFVVPNCGRVACEKFPLHSICKGVRQQENMQKFEEFFINQLFLRAMYDYNKLVGIGDNASS